MNIFVTDEDPVLSALYLDDKRVIKMTLESAQIICTVLSMKGFEVPYKPTHKKHPVVLWAYKSKFNLSWLCIHFVTLAEIYNYMTGKIHASFLAVGELAHQLIIKPKDNLSFCNCARNMKQEIDFKNIESTIEAYRLYLNERWKRDKRKPIWTSREKPKWCDV